MISIAGIIVLLPIAIFSCFFFLSLYKFPLRVLNIKYFKLLNYVMINCAWIVTRSFEIK